MVQEYYTNHWEQIGNAQKKFNDMNITNMTYDIKLDHGTTNSRGAIM